MIEQETSVRELLLARRGLVFVSSSGRVEGAIVQAVELELADLGYVLSARLRGRLEQCSLDELRGLRVWMLDALQTHVGAGQRHA